MTVALVVLAVIILGQGCLFVWMIAKHIEEAREWQIERASLLDRIMARNFETLSMARTQEKMAESETEETPVYFDDLNEDDFIGPKEFIAGVEKEGE